MDLQQLQGYLGVDILDEVSGAGQDLPELHHQDEQEGSRPRKWAGLHAVPAAAAAVTASADAAADPRAASAANGSAGASVLERLQEVDLAQKLGYLLCKCSWPPQIMVLSTSDFIYRCPRCARVRDL